MFWRFGLQSSSNIDSLLEKENVKLEEILEEVDFLQECKSKNQKLLEFLSKPETVIKLLDYIAKLHLVPVHLPPTPTTQTSPDTQSTTTDKKDESDTQNKPSSTSNQAHSDQQTMEPLFDEKLLIKFPYLVSELFSIDAAELLDAVLNTPNLLPNFINTILDLPPPINPTQASYWAKVMAQFMIKKTTPTLRIIKNTENIIQKLMKHAVLNMSIMDVTMKLIGVEELPDGRNEHMIEWLSQQKFIPLLVDHLDPNLSPDIHGSVATAMLDIIAISQAVSFDGVPMEVNVLIKELKSEATVQRMVKYMLDRQAPNSSSTLIQVISVVVEFIRRNYDEPPGMLPQGTPPSDGLQGRLPPAPMNLSGIIRVFCLHLQHFQELLRNPRACQPIETTVGKIVPLGQERLRICELLAELLRCAIDDVHYTETPMNPPSQQPPTQPPPPSQTIESHTSPMAVDSPKSPPSNTTDDDDAKSQTSDATDSSVPTTAIGTTPSESKTDQTSTQTSTSSSQPPITVKIETSPSYTLDGVSSLNGPELQALLVKQFADTKIIVTALDLFFAFPWNNLLHGLVYDLIALSLNAPMDKCKALALSVLKDGQSTKRITAAQRSSDYEATQPKGVRLGYMGHLTIIADEVCKWYEREEVLRNELQDLFKAEDWQEYITKTLRETRERDLASLGGARPNSAPSPMVNYHHSGTSDDPVTEELDDDDHALDMTSGGVENDQFARYLCQQISNDLPDKFGIAEDDDDDDDTDSLWTGDFMRSPFSQMKYQQNDSFTSTSTRQSFAEVEEDSDEDSQKQDTNQTAVTASTTQALLTPADWTANFEAAFNGGTDSNDISSTVASFTAPLESSSDDDDDDENDGEGGDDDTAELPTGKEESTS